MDRACSTLVRKVKSITVYNSKPEERYLVRNPWDKRRDKDTKRVGEGGLDTAGFRQRLVAGF
jgi:hypothetical protein